VIETAGQEWHAGSQISVRGQLWTILERTPFADCDALRLRGAEPANWTTVQTILLPFDRPRAPRPSPSIEVMRPRRWLRAVTGQAVNVNPFGGLSSAAASTIAFLPYQLQPALAMLRGGHARVLIADAVGLGKTIQAGLILRQVATERGSFRALVITPAGLREQWAAELTARFALSTSIATSDWLSRMAARLPPDINVWSLPGIYVSSFDFIKRPEVLGSLEDVAWDVLVVDEAHAATSGSARYAAVHSLALRGRRVILLSATPHGGDAEQFRALCGLGSPAREAEPILIFRRSRAEVGTVGRRRTVLLPVRLSDAERRMHRALETYAARLCAESRSGGDPRGRLAAIVLAKRSLSSPASLARSCRRRRDLLAAAGPSHDEQQLHLPLGGEDILEDDEPASILAAPGLTDAAQEQRCLETIVDAADEAARDESKLRLLRRLLRRTREPAIVFTEYRDTLERIRTALAGFARHITVLHGGMDAGERSAAQREFNAAGSLLLATDAASEGLNLHHRCRMVIHFELPWNPSRIEQRTGRVDRIGQTRIVHELILVANDTAERLVLAPLVKRAARARNALPGQSPLFDVLTESRIAEAVMEGEPVRPSVSDAGLYGTVPSVELEADARREAARLADLRTWLAHAGRHESCTAIAATVLPAKRRTLPPGVICVFTLRLIGADGNERHGELLAIHDRWPVPPIRYTRAALRRLVDVFCRARNVWIEKMLLESLAPRHGEITGLSQIAAAAAERRDHIVVALRRSAAQQLVQPGLFDAQNVQKRRGPVLDDARWHLDRTEFEAPLTPVLSLSAILAVTSRRRA
jgi:ERCC4-related helicase